MGPTNTFKTDAVHERPEVIWLKGREQARTYVGWYVSTTKNELPNRDKSFHPPAVEMNLRSRNQSHNLGE